MSIVKLKPHLTLPLRIPTGSGDGLIYYDSGDALLRLATGPEIEDVIYADTYWTDLQVSLTSTRQGALSKPDFDYDNLGYLFPQNDTSEVLYFITQMPHSWKEGTTIYPHIHWHQTADQTPVFKLDYKLYNNGTAVPAGFTTYTISTKVFTYTSGTLAQISGNATGIPMTGMNISAMLLCKLYRNDNAYTGDCLAQQIDFHYEVDSAGSDTEYVK